MVTTTSRNGLSKPGYTDAADIGVVNNNMDTIDAAIAKGNYAATAPPTVNDDKADGYSPGSIWVDVANHRVYVCEVATVGTAVWNVLASGSDAATLDGIPASGFVQQTLADAKGDLIVASKDDTFTRMAVGNNGETLMCHSSEANGIAWSKMVDSASRQILINGDFIINEYGINTYTSTTNPANADDKYLHDMWTLLSDGDNIVEVSVGNPDVPVGHAGSVKFTVFTPNKKFGYIQFIENKNSVPAIGNVVSLSFWAKTTVGKSINNIRAAVLSWSGTTDTLTSDVVSAWGAAETNFTPIANWTIENTPVNLELTAAWQEFKIEGISIDTSSTVNLAVFIWCDDTNAALDDELFLSGVQLNLGKYALPWANRDYTSELLKCKRYLLVINAAAGAAANLGTATCFWSPAIYYESLHSSEWFKDAATLTSMGNWRVAGVNVITIDRFASECIQDNTVIVGYNDTTGFTEGFSYIIYTNNDKTARLYIESRL